MGNRRKDTTGPQETSKTSESRKALVDPALRDALRALDPAGYALSLLPEGLYRQVECYLNGPLKKGRRKGKQQPETLQRKVDAAALVRLGYSQSKMVPLLYPGQHDPEAGRKAVNTFLRRNKAAIADAVRGMTDEQAAQIARYLPRHKN